MEAPDPIVQEVYAALEVEPAANLHASEVTVTHHQGVVILQGEVPDIAGKRRAVLAAACVPGVRVVVDQLRTAAAEAMSDATLRDHVRDALLREPALTDHDLEVVDKKDQVEPVRRLPETPHGCVRIRVEDGVVVLEGKVLSLSHRRMAGVLAWWVPGTRDVENDLVVEPPEEDNDGELADAVELVLELDGAVRSDQITIRAHDARVTLSGTVGSDRERVLAERDAWYVDGVRQVENLLLIP